MLDSDFAHALDQVLSGPRTEAGAHAICTLFRASTPAQRDLLRSRIRISNWSRCIPDVSALADGVARALPAPERIRDALTWQAIEGGQVDIRDNLMGIILIYHSALRLGLDTEKLFSEGAEIAPPALGDAIRHFPDRAPGDRTLSAFGYREVPTPTGVRFVAG